jgi:hypothetical protein
MTAQRALSPPQVTDALRAAGRLDLPGQPAAGGVGIEVYVDGGVRHSINLKFTVLTQNLGQL